MCGIAAIFAYASSAPGVDEGELLAIRDHMTRRGPDGAGLWFDPARRVGLGHRRLSIIDVSAAGAQPMLLPERRLAITFNGEIYNYQELRADLERRGHQFRSACDTEVLLRLYAEEGEAMLPKLRGMFAFALWDGVRQELFLARDSFGIKPLYWADDGKTFRAASQVKALLAGGRIDTAPEPAGHVGFFLWGHVPEPYTLHRGVRTLPAGHCLTLDASGRKRLRKFCSVPDLLAEVEAARTPAPGAALLPVEALGAALRDTVRHHLIADVPVGIFLSAGLDSSTLVALASECGGQLRTVTLGFQEFQGTVNDEVPLAEETARHYGARHETIWIARHDFENDLNRLLHAMDQPSIDGVNSFFISRAATQAGLKVALSGLGGDELFGSYPSFREIPRVTSLMRWLQPLWPLGRGFRAVSAPFLKQMTSPKYAGLVEYGTNYPGAYLLRRGMFMPWELPEILDADLVRAGWQELQTLARLGETMAGLSSPHLRISALEMSWYMRHQLLRDTDWASMDHSLEIRVPFVDAQLLRAAGPLFAGAAPLTKRHMAATLRRPLPEAVVNRPKTGFLVPVRRWLAEVDQKTNPAESPVAERGLRGWTHVVYRHFEREFGVGNVYAPRRGTLRRRPTENPGPRATAAGTKSLIVLLSDAFGGFGGIAKFNRDLLTAISAHPATSRVLAIPRVIQHPVDTLPPKLDYIAGAANRKTSFLAQLWKQSRAFESVGPTDMIVCAHINLLPAAFLVRATLSSRPPIVLTIHGIDAWQRTGKPLVDYLAKKVDAFVAVSNFTRDRFMAWTGIDSGKGFVLPNCVELARYAPGCKNRELLQRYQLEGRRILLTFGRLHPEERYKGIDEILEVLGALRQQVPDLAYLVVGDGGDRSRLEQKAARLGLRDAVIFAGRISEPEKADHYRLADVYVMPGRGEGFGIVYLEAMACGLPVIASKLDGSREAVRDGALGKLVDPANPEELKAAILDSLSTVPAPEQRRVPPGLDYFSYQNFERRCHQVLQETWGRN